MENNVKNWNGQWDDIGIRVLLLPLIGDIWPPIVGT